MTWLLTIYTVFFKSDMLYKSYAFRVIVTATRPVRPWACVNSVDAVLLPVNVVHEVYYADGLRFKADTVKYGSCQSARSRRRDVSN